MLDSLLRSLILAQAPDAAPAAQPQNLMLIVLLYGVPFAAMYYFLLHRPRQKREQEHKNMVAALKKNDHVVTYGGIKGVVVSVKPEEDEIVVKIDENNGTRLRLVLSSVARVIADEAEAAGSGKKEAP
jgi:preprotein translocase subunit YajC